MLTSSGTVLRTGVFVVMVSTRPVVLNDHAHCRRSACPQFDDFHARAARRTTPTIPPYEIPSSTSAISAGMGAREDLLASRVQVSEGGRGCGSGVQAFEAGADISC